MSKEILLINLAKIHTTKMGIERIKSNLKIKTWKWNHRSSYIKKLDDDSYEK